MLRFTLLFALFAGLMVSDGTAQEKKQWKGKAFEITQHFDLNNCAYLAQCDCCSAHLVLLDDSRFVYSSPCVADDYYNRGSYEVSKTQLTLHFDSVLVKSIYNWDSESDTTLTPYELTREKIKPSYFSFEFITCGEEEKLLSGGEHPFFGQQQPHFDLKDYLKEFKATQSGRLLLSDF